MAKLFRTAQAAEDLIDIWLYIANDNLTAADKMLSRFESVFETLTEQPEFGVARPDIAPDLRHFPVGKYLILYSIIGGDVEIMRVVHGSRLLSQLGL
jgi:toxin ParE1/3/4